MDFRLLAAARPRTLAFAAIAVGLSAAAAPAPAQYLDARVLTRGTFRIGFEPSYLSYDRRFDPDGEQEPLGFDLSADSAGPMFLPSLEAPQAAVRSLLGDATYRMSFGTAQTDLDADVRTVPFNFQLGLADRVTIAASVPFVTSRMQVAFTVDSANANVGWNQIASASGNNTGASETLTLLQQLTASTSALDALIAAGGFDCPSGPTCDAARSLVDRSALLTTDLIGLTGIDGGGSVVAELPPFVPLASSAAGQAILAVIQDIGTEFTGFGVSPITATLPLPTGHVTAEDVNTVLTTAGFGYDAGPLEFNKYRQRFGDAEVGIRWGLVQTPNVRVAVTTGVRLPTGIRDMPGNFVDIGTGDRQTDLIGGVELAFEPGNVVSFGLAGEYTLQLEDQLLRRITTPDRPIALAATEFTVSRDLGDIIRLHAFPALRLHPSLSAYTSVEYFDKQSDVVTIAQSNGNGGSAPDPMELELETRMQRLSVGAGLHYRSLNRTSRVPVEAGLHYQTALQGSGGLTPMTTRMSLYLRLFYRLFGRSAADNDSS